MFFFIYFYFIFFFFLMIRRPPRSTLILHSFPTRRSSDLRDGRRRPHHRRRHGAPHRRRRRSEEHTSELQSHSEISYAVFCLKKKKTHRGALPDRRRSRRPRAPTGALPCRDHRPHQDHGRAGLRLFFTDPAPPKIYTNLNTLPLPDALPI